MKNWKTTLAGIAAIVGVAAKIVNEPSSLTASDIGAILAGVGLIYSKDRDITGAGANARRAQ
jgi:hypothetical protein